MRIVESTTGVPKTASNLKQRVDAALNAALGETVRKSSAGPEEVIKRIGEGSYEHTNFRFFLAPRIVEILDGMEGVGKVRQAWVHSIDVTESDPSAADKAGDGSPCDWSMGLVLPLIAKVDGKNKSQAKAVDTLNGLLVAALHERRVEVVDDYLRVNFVTAEEIAAGRGEAARIRNPYNPATEISFEKPP
ncbi:MAG: hypothetical protein ABH834_01765 [Candidatus Altiarchaeota archaeon]